MILKVLYSGNNRQLTYPCKVGGESRQHCINLEMCRTCGGVEGEVGEGGGSGVGDLKVLSDDGEDKTNHLTSVPGIYKNKL